MVYYIVTFYCLSYIRLIFIVEVLKMNLTIKSYMKILDASPDKRSDYDKRYETIVSQITAKWYTYSGHVVCHIRIPSEKTSKVSYDVLLEFAVNPNVTLKDFVNSKVSVFSNCPSFIFTNAKFCYEHGMGIGWARTLMNQATLEAKREEPGNKDTKEPQTAIKCEKSLYFAMKYLIGLNAIELFTALNGANKVHSTNAILAHIRNADKTMDKRQKAANKPTAKPAIKPNTHVSANEANKINKLSKTKVVKAVSKSKTTSANKKVKKIKHI